MNNVAELQAIIIGEIKNVMPKSNDIVEIVPEMSLTYDLGLDSISLVSLLHNLEKNLNFDLVAVLSLKITEIHTIEQLTMQICHLMAIE